MSREIKFRAWIENEHVQSLVYPFMNYKVVFSGGLINDIFATSGTQPINTLHNKITYMQYTGLKDKNGVEIYEGDVLTSEHYPFQDGGEYNYHGLVEWGEEEAAFYLTKYLANKDKRGISHGISEMLGQEDLSEFEVIGNKYEHSHLLEVAQ